MSALPLWMNQHCYHGRLFIRGVGSWSKDSCFPSPSLPSHAIIQQEGLHQMQSPLVLYFSREPNKWLWFMTLPVWGYSDTVIENEQRQLLHRESRGKGERGRKLPLKNTSKKKCVPKWNCSHVVSMYFPSDGWWDVNHLWNQTGPVQAPVPTGACCFWLARSLVSWRTTSTSWGVWGTGN